MFDEAVSDENVLGATGPDAHMVWTAFRRELPMLYVIFFAPLVLGLVFLPPAVEIVANIRLARPYSPLRAAFLVIEATWVTVAIFLGRRGLLLVKVARYLRKEAGYRWGVEQKWVRDRAQKAAKRRKAEGAAEKPAGAEEARSPDGGDSAKSP